MKSKKLTFTEALMLVAGAGIGTGILTIPYAVSQIGILGTLSALLAAYAVSAVIYLMIADLAKNSERRGDLIAILDEQLFSGKSKQVLNICFFILLVLLLIENLVVYILCASDVISDLLGSEPIISKLLFYTISSLVIFFGVKGMGVGEKISVALIGVTVLVLTVLSCFNVKGQLDISFGNAKTVFAVYGLFMFAFSAIFSIIQAVSHIENPKLTGKAVIGGLTLNALITVVFTAAVILGSEKVTEIATIGLADSIGIWFVKLLCSILVIFAMLTSFWSSGFAFSDVVSSQFGIPKKLSWFIATLPALGAAILIPLSVLEYVQIGAGALSVILVIVVLPAYYNAVKTSKSRPLLGRLATSKLLIAIIAAAIILMAVSSLIPVN